jgi:hypothetical protein
MPDKNKDYIGDGVYVEYDGYGITLKANSPDAPTDTIYLEPSVMVNLQNFVQRVYGKEKS